VKNKKGLTRNDNDFRLKFPDYQTKSKIVDDDMKKHTLSLAHSYEISVHQAVMTDEFFNVYYKWYLHAFGKETD
jgi:hypothetical protein